MRRRGTPASAEGSRARRRRRRARRRCGRRRVTEACALCVAHEVPHVHAAATPSDVGASTLEVPVVLHLHSNCGGWQSELQSPTVTNMCVSTASGTVGLPGSTSAVRLDRNRRRRAGGQAGVLDDGRGGGHAEGRARRDGAVVWGRRHVVAPGGGAGDHERVHGLPQRNHHHVVQALVHPLHSSRSPACARRLTKSPERSRRRRGCGGSQSSLTSAGRAASGRPLK
ncbi:unnamed protein product [Urochloa humidicola]